MVGNVILEPFVLQQFALRALASHGKPPRRPLSPPKVQIRHGSSLQVYTRAHTDPPEHATEAEPRTPGT